MQTLQDQVSRGGGSSTRQPSYAPPAQSGGSDLVAQLLTRVDALEEQVRQLRGRVDETQNQVKRQNDDLGKRIDDLTFQVNPQGGQPGAASGGRSGRRLPRSGTGLDGAAVPASAARAAGSTAPRTGTARG